MVMPLFRLAKVGAVVHLLPLTLLQATDVAVNPALLLSFNRGVAMVLGPALVTRTV